MSLTLPVVAQLMLASVSFYMSFSLFDYFILWLLSGMVCSMFICYLCCSSGISHFSKEPWFSFSRKWYFKAMICYIAVSFSQWKQAFSVDIFAPSLSVPALCKVITLLISFTKISFARFRTLYKCNYAHILCDWLSSFSMFLRYISLLPVWVVHFFLLSNTIPLLEISLFTN